MKWQGGKQSGNFEDRRGMSGGGKIALGGIGGIIVLVIGFLMGGDPSQLLQQAQNMGWWYTNGWLWHGTGLLRTFLLSWRSKDLPGSEL